MSERGEHGKKRELLRGRPGKKAEGKHFLEST